MNHSLSADIIFSIASIILSVSLFPQIAKVYKKKSASQFSWWFLISTAIGTGMFSGGKFLVGCFIAGTIDLSVFLCYIVLNVLKFRYRKYL